MTRKDRTEGIYSRREVLDESERRQYCLIQLKDLLSYAYRYSEDVKKRFDRAQFNVEKFKTLSDIKHIPILKKKELIFLQSMGPRLGGLLTKDIGDLKFGVENDFDYVAASFVRSADDIRSIRETLDSFGGQMVKIIAKIENQEGVDNLDEILALADGVMVARGDLGVEIPAARVPVLQKQMIRKGKEAGKPIITATQMLDSMIRNPRPTRAEVSDVANAVFDGTSCVMLSGETAGGKYPLEALKAMVSIVEEAESSVNYWKRFREYQFSHATNINDAVTHTGCLTAMDLNAKAIAVATSTGRAARMVARFRPACPIAALTMHEKVRRQLAICWGISPYLTGEVNSTDRIFSVCAETTLKEGLVEKGDTVVITAGVPLGKSGSTNLIKAQIITDDI